MKDNTAIAISAIGTVGAIECVALLCGHNGQILRFALMTIAGIAAGAIGYKLNRTDVS